MDTAGVGAGAGDNLVAALVGDLAYFTISAALWYKCNSFVVKRRILMLDTYHA